MAAATAIIAGVGVAVSAAGTAMSFGQAAQQQRNIRTAQAKADQAMEAARKKLEVNYYDSLAIQKEPYELEREALLSSAAQVTSPELGRAAAASAGRVQMAMNDAQAGIRTAMGKEKMALDQQSAMERSRLRDINFQVDTTIAAGAQQAISDAEQAKSAAIAQGVQGLAQTAQAASQLVPLYQESQATRAFNKSEAGYNKAAAAGTLPEAFKQNGKYVSYQQAASMVLNDPSLSTVSNLDFTDELIGRGKGYIRGINYMDYTGQQKQPDPVKINIAPATNNNMNYFDFINSPWNTEPNNSYWINNN
jgi:hypothetical protein